MKRALTLLSLILVPFLLTAQSVLITPGAQTLNGDSTNQNQLNAFGNGLLVGPKVKFTDEDPASNVHQMDCGSTVTSISLAGTLKDPNGDSDYLEGLLHDCEFIFRTSDPLFVAYQIDFEVLDTQAEEDTVFIMQASNVLASFSGNTLPESFRINWPWITIRFKTNDDSNVGAGFDLKWRAILRDETPTTIQNYTGQGLVYDVRTHAFWTGGHRPLDFENKGAYSTALGYNTAASGDYSTAMGYNTKASGQFSLAMGDGTKALGHRSTAMGIGSKAANYSAVAMGQNSVASGYSAKAMGSQTEASGQSSTAMGTQTEASGYSSTAMGLETEAAGSYSTAMGNDSHAYGESAIAMGEGSLAISNYSIAMGRNTITTDSSAVAMGGFTKAFGKYSTAMGKSTTANGYASTAIGYETTASGLHSTAMGDSAIASGDYSTAMGRNTIAEESYSTALGFNTTASGYSATAMGFGTMAGGNYSTAMGQNTTANGNNSTAMGTNVAANGQGTLIIGDSNPGGLLYTSGNSDKFIARFYNGYYFLTSATGATSRGVQISHDQTAWSSISDSTQKENFIAANGEDFLEKLKGLRLGSWNYKTKETNPERFYGPMAQEVFAAYGQDAIGTIGSDTLVNTLNMDGLLFIFAQELEKRTENLQKETADLKKENELLNKSNQDLKQSLVSLEKSIKTELIELKALLVSSLSDNEKPEQGRMTKVSK